MTTVDLRAAKQGYEYIIRRTLLQFFCGAHDNLDRASWD